LLSVFKVWYFVEDISEASKIEGINVHNNELIICVVKVW